MSLNAIDAFAGAGGLSMGIGQAGFRVRLAFDSDQVSVDTHRKNLAGDVEVLDASAVAAADLLELAGLGVGEIDLLAGGPPCQGFSLQRRGVRDDPRNRLVLRFLDWLADMRPRSFLIENVKAIRSVRGSAVIEAVEAKAAELGYSTHARILDAADYGLPQVRKRAFLVGIRDSSGFEWPTPSQVRLTVRDAIADLPEPPGDGSPHQDIPNHYQEGRLSALNLERIRAVPEGGGRLDLPLGLQLACHSGTHRHLDTYGRLAWDKPAGTVTARFDSFTRGRFGHPTQDRSITLREGARLQGFPDDFVFLGNREQGARMIGNAVPPPLARAVAERIAVSLLSPHS